ncbi:hypothetical protein llap_3123 [Limosa lapponica baueri]|uniref:Uncharacterized protein n=1 Tax=Limosa lapponica baueri TaxID=1758121 RepID=A0A2I0UKJ6_LIMLA|nr:hypothetical protein llap_3123 [Limosa lapponica baueri]
MPGPFAEPPAAANSQPGPRASRRTRPPQREEEEEEGRISKARKTTALPGAGCQAFTPLPPPPVLAPRGRLRQVPGPPPTPPGTGLGGDRELPPA